MNLSDGGLYHKAAVRIDAILVVCDRLSKITHFVTTTEETLAEGLTRLFRDNI